MSKFKPIAFTVFGVTTAIFVALLGSQFFANDHALTDIRDIDGGTYMFYLVTLVFSELLALSIYKLFNRLYTFLNNFFVAILTNILGMAAAIFTSTLFH